ncbi:MAG: DUF2202 domain-containing protein [Gemmatimonadota bacterium]
MRYGRRLRLTLPLVGVLVASGVLAACDDDPTTSSSEPLTADVMAVLEEAIQDEYRAENIYLRVLADHGDVIPFRNIVYAEERHSQALGWLFVSRGLAVPLSDWDLGNVPTFGTVAEACAAGVIAEQENIAMYDDFLAETLPADVRTVFTNNRAASLDRHLPAFQACS